MLYHEEVLPEVICVWNFKQGTRLFSLLRTFKQSLFHLSPNAEDNMARCITRKYDTLEPINPESPYIHVLLSILQTDLYTFP